MKKHGVWRFWLHPCQTYFRHVVQWRCYLLFQLKTGQVIKGFTSADGSFMFKFSHKMSMCIFPLWVIPYEMTLATCPAQLLSISQVEDVATGFAVLWEHGLETQSNTGASGAVCSCNVTAICDTLIWRCLVQREVTVRHCCCLYRADYLFLNRHGKCCCCGLSGARHSALFNVSAAGWSALGRSSVHVYVGSLQDAHVFSWEALDVGEGAQLGRHLQPGACEYLTMRGAEPHAADRYRWFSNGGLTLGMKCYMFVWNEVC